MKLVLFDCDGTLVDSQNAIAMAMDEAFDAQQLASPGRAKTLSIVGLSLPEAIAALAPLQAKDMQVRLAEGYRAAAQRIRLAHAEDPLFPGADAAVRALAARDDTLLGTATGKSLRGVDRMIAHQKWDGFFATLQTRRRQSLEARSRHDPARTLGNRRECCRYRHDRRHDLRHANGPRRGRPRDRRYLGLSSCRRPACSRRS